MSSTAIPTVRAPVRSTQIQLENLISFSELSRMEMKIAEEEPTRYHTWLPDYACRHTKDIANIINVFNDNVNYANKEIEKFVPFQERSFEQYCDEHPNHTLEDYRLDELARKSDFKEMKREVKELYQLGDTFYILAKKITLIKKGLEEKNSLDKKIQLCELVPCASPTHLPAFTNYKCLRTVETPKVPLVLQEPVDDTPMKTLDSTPVETVVSLPAPTALKIDVTVLCQLSSEKTLGICCHPTWDQQPTLFTKGESGWTGQVPIDQDWKFVTLENGQVKGWEQGKNRRCNSQTQAFTVKPNEVKFG